MQPDATTILTRTATDMGNSEATGTEVTLPWQKTSPLSERKRFVDLHLQGEHSIAELCRRFRISSKTGYQWLRRFFDGCELVDRSRRRSDPDTWVTDQPRCLRSYPVRGAVCRPRLQSSRCATVRSGSGWRASATVSGLHCV